MKTGKIGGRRAALAALAAVAAAAAMLLGGCATVKGLGRDIQSVGQAGSDAIN